MPAYSHTECSLFQIYFHLTSVLFKTRRQPSKFAIQIRSNDFHSDEIVA